MELLKHAIRAGAWILLRIFMFNYTNTKGCSVDVTLFYLFCSKMQGLATADLAHGNRELSLRFVADRKFV
jgi:hypothetical protein